MQKLKGWLRKLLNFNCWLNRCTQYLVLVQGHSVAGILLVYFITNLCHIATTQLNTKLSRHYFTKKTTKPQNYKPQNHLSLFLSSYTTKLDQIQYATLFQPNQKIHAQNNQSLVSLAPFLNLFLTMSPKYNLFFP